MRRREAGGDRGATVIELALLMPVVLVVVLLIVQMALWFHGRQVADAAAREGARIARAGDDGWQEAAEAKARQIIQAIGPEILQAATATACGTGRSARRGGDGERGPGSYRCFPRSPSRSRPASAGRSSVSGPTTAAGDVRQMTEQLGDRGSMSVETVMLAPVLLLFLLFLVGAGRVVEAQGEVNGAACDAARAASVQRDEGAAQEAATLGGDRRAHRLPAARCRWRGRTWEQGGVVEVTVSCSLDLDFLGFGTSVTISGDSVVPLEQFRRVE